MNFKVLCFDLDDTLFDTQQILVPLALKKSFTAMQDMGLNCNYDSFLEFHRKISHQPEDFFLQATRYFLKKDDLSPAHPIVQAGSKEFYQNNIDIDIALSPSIIPLLKKLKQKYSLHLVTSGHQASQQKKVSLLKLDTGIFKSCWFAAPLNSSKKTNSIQALNFPSISKKKIFSEILTQENSPPKQALSIGNRIDHEIKEAKEVGYKTCLINQGEYINLKPKSSLEAPDFTINTIEDLISTCKL